MAGIRRKYIRHLAQKLLNKEKILAAPVDIVKIVRAHNIAIRYEPAEQQLSGFLLRTYQPHKAVIGINQDHTANRQRFTIAHELGHYLLHNSETLHVDRKLQVKRRDGTSSKGMDVEEIESNLFAAELLMPPHFIKQDLSNIREIDLFDDEIIRNLAKRYRVSIQAFTIRLSYLNYIHL